MAWSRETRNKCRRCGDDLIISTMSYFDESEICLRCDEVERSHPSFEEARRVESEHVGRGNYNFEGVGLPPEIVAMCREARDKDHI